jgi:hypothetical protein
LGLREGRPSFDLLPFFTVKKAPEASLSLMGTAINEPLFGWLARISSTGWYPCRGDLQVACLEHDEEQEKDEE